MSCSYHFLLVSLALVLPTVQGQKYTVIDNAGDTKGAELFHKTLGKVRATVAMKMDSNFIWIVVFDQQKLSDQKQVKEIRLVLQPTLNEPVSCREHQQVHEIYLSATHLENFVPANFDSVDHFLEDRKMTVKVRREIWGMITYGVACALQWTANGDIPEKLQRAIAAAVTIKATQDKLEYSAKAGAGTRWDESYDVMAQFFYYINKKKTGFLANLNKKMKEDYHDSYIQEAAGMSIDDYWKMYKTDNPQE